MNRQMWFGDDGTSSENLTRCEWGWQPKRYYPCPPARKQALSFETYFYLIRHTLLQTGNLKTATESHRKTKQLQPNRLQTLFMNCASMSRCQFRFK